MGQILYEVEAPRPQMGKEETESDLLMMRCVARVINYNVEVAIRDLYQSSEIVLVAYITAYYVNARTPQPSTCSGRGPCQGRTPELQRSLLCGDLSGCKCRRNDPGRKLDCVRYKSYTAHFWRPTTGLPGTPPSVANAIASSGLLPWFQIG